MMRIFLLMEMSLVYSWMKKKEPFFRGSYGYEKELPPKIILEKIYQNSDFIRDQLKIDQQNGILNESILQDQQYGWDIKYYKSKYKMEDSNDNVYLLKLYKKINIDLENNDKENL